MSRRWFSPFDLLYLLRWTRWAVLASSLTAWAGLHWADWSNEGNGHGSVAVAVLVVFGGILCAIGLIFAAVADCDEWDTRRRRVEVARRTRWVPRRVVVEPDGEYVNVWLYERGCDPLCHRLHALDDAERAYEIVAAFKQEAAPSPEAKALAKALR